MRTMSKLAEHIKQLPSRRNPAYRPAMTIDEEERAELAKKLGDADNYELVQLREMVQADPDNIEFRKALVSGIASAEYAGIDAFSRKVCEWQDWEAPWSLITAMARQTWDEVRHAQLATGILESYGGKIGEYPDTLAGGVPQTLQQGVQQAAQATQPAGAHASGHQGGAAGPPGAGMMSDPVASLSMVNVSLEGGALVLFKETSKLGERIGDDMLERGEVFEIKILNMDTQTGTDLTTDLPTDTTFTLEVIPPKGAVLYIQRVTPVSFELYTLLN